MQTNDAVKALSALAQETRLSIFRLLVEAGPTGLAAGEIAAAVGAAPTNLSFHLKELAHAGLVHSRQDGRFVFYSAHYAHMNQLIGYLTEHCCERDGGGCEPCSTDRCSTDKPKSSKKGVRA
jgi:DNA-binding transcriptional ArsR family regulator